MIFARFVYVWFRYCQKYSFQTFRLFFVLQCYYCLWAGEPYWPEDKFGNMKQLDQYQMTSAGQQIR